MQKLAKRYFVACGLTAALAAGAAVAQESSGPAAPVSQYVARLMDSNGKRVGTVVFLPLPGNRTQVSAFVWEGSGVAPGPHGIHVHTNPSCADSTDASGAAVKFSGAGGHLDPNNTGNHDKPDAPVTSAHAGDLPNIEVREGGTGNLLFVSDKLSTTAGPTSVQGRAVVLHAAADDYATDPAGNSGARIACGIVQTLGDNTTPVNGAAASAAPASATAPAQAATAGASTTAPQPAAGTQAAATTQTTTTTTAQATPLPTPVLRGAEATVFGATAYTWARLNAVGQVTEAGLTVPLALIEAAPAAAAGAAPAEGKPLARLAFPEIVKASTFLDNADVYWNPAGHPPVYQAPHFDFHFFGVPAATVEAIDCKDLKQPQASAIPQGWAPPVPPNVPAEQACVPLMGFHASPAADLAGGANWSSSMILVSYGGAWLALEPMITREALLKKSDITLPVPQIAVGRETRLPTKFTARWVAAENAYQLVFSDFVNVK